MGVVSIPTTSFAGQKPGTSGLRKRTKEFMQEHYVENFCQACLTVAGDTLKGATLVVGGDGRYYNDVMVQKIWRLCAANGVGKVVIGQHGLLSTPAVSALIRSLGAAGGFILTASHNPGGPENDCGLKYNVANGGPAPESFTQAVYEGTQTITEYLTLDSAEDIDLGVVAETQVSDGFTVEVIDSTDDYCALMKKVFDFSSIKNLLDRDDFDFCFDGMHGVAGPYAKRVFHEELGVPLAMLQGCVPQPDFGGGHPDPNLTYAHDLVERMGLSSKGEPLEGVSRDDVPDFGAAADGDADRNMVLGKQFFVTPSDSLAVIAANSDAIPFFKDAGGLKSVARSMPTSEAADHVAKANGLGMFQVPTGWKFFGNLMDSAALGKEDFNPLICGEESFGTGSNHIREKDGLWAVLAWLSVLAFHNTDSSKPLCSVEDIVREHWTTYGRSYYSRYDYENVDSALAKTFTDNLTALTQSEDPSSIKVGSLSLSSCDEFNYEDPVDESVSRNQGWRFLFEDGSRFVFRLSGTGSVGATIRLYIEKYEKENVNQPTAQALEAIVNFALTATDLVETIKRESPTVIT
mmetsp:Transcript_24089/g.44708  ORF Transcript_24089/g.44708 Transcript_24089/m.44708 type:complete len:576 (+) Transcript_24089:172-1899(+)